LSWHHGRFRLLSIDAATASLAQERKYFADGKLAVSTVHPVRRSLPVEIRLNTARIQPWVRFPPNFVSIQFRGSTFRYMIACEGFLVYHLRELRLLLIGHGERTVGCSRPACWCDRDCMNTRASELEQIGKAGGMKCDAAFVVNNSCRNTSCAFRVPRAIHSPFLRRADILGCERAGGEL
jgi:hypothetical protein